MDQPRLDFVQCLGGRGLHRMAYWEWGERDNTNVVVCASDNPGALNATCRDGAFTGWIVFVDGNTNWQHEVGETVLASHETVQNGLQVRSDGSGNYDTLHHGTPVRAGYKAIITKWFRRPR